MKKVFICSPYRGEVESNKAKARDYCRAAIKQGYLPIAPHLYFTEFLDDTYEKERVLGIAAGIELMSLCDEMWVYGEPTEGMKQEILTWGKEMVWKVK